MKTNEHMVQGSKELIMQYLHASLSEKGMAEARALSDTRIVEVVQNMMRGGEGQGPSEGSGTDRARARPGVQLQPLREHG